MRLFAFICAIRFLIGRILNMLTEYFAIFCACRGVSVCVLEKCLRLNFLFWMCVYVSNTGKKTPIVRFFLLENASFTRKPLIPTYTNSSFSWLLLLVCSFLSWAIKNISTHFFHNLCHTKTNTHTTAIVLQTEINQGLCMLVHAYVHCVFMCECKYVCRLLNKRRVPIYKLSWG